MESFCRNNGHTTGKRETNSRIRKAVKKKGYLTKTKSRKKQTWKSVFEYAIIHLGLLPEQFYNLTLYEYRCLVARQAFKTANEWAHTRKLEWIIRSVNSEKKVELYDLMPLLIDPIIPEPKKMSEKEKQRLAEEGKKRIAAYQAHINNHNK